MGSLKERNPSLWVGTTHQTSYKPLSRKGTFDVVVIGAGITGLTTGLLLKREGLRVAVLEAGRIASGVTGYTTAKVTALHGLIHSELLDRHGRERTAAYADANVAGIKQIADNVSELEIDCDFERMEAYTYAESADGAEKIRKEVSACRDVGLPAEMVSKTPLPFPVTAAVRLPDQAMFHPRKYCIGLAAAIHGGSGRVYENTRVAEVEELKRVCHVKTEKETLSTPWVVVATHMPFMGDGNFFAKEYPYRSYATAVRITDGIPEGMFISVEAPTRSLRPHRSGGERWLIVGGEGHKVGQDPETEDHYETLESWARERLPGVGLVDFRWSAQDYLTMDGMPYVGRLTDDHQRVFVATGFRKWGMTNGTAAARIITDAIAGRENPWAEAYDATRTRPRQAAKDFAKENINVAKHLVGDRLLASESSLDELRPGEGAIVDVGGETMAAYRDDSGVVHALSPDCTHMKCRVSFNPAERSWDCPCHGSRFGTDGRVLEGPANQDLEKKKIGAEASGRRR